MRRCLVVAASLAAALPLRAAPEIPRLGTAVVPVSEDVTLDLDPRKSDYTGSVAVVLDVTTAVTSFRFHAEEIDLGSITLTREMDGAKPVTLAAKPVDEGMVEVAAGAPLAPGRYTLAIDFKNDFNRNAVGLYRLESGGAWYAFTQFEAIDARRAFPCWDEPSFKIPWRVTLTVPEGEVAVANTPEERSSAKDGQRTVVFRRTRPLPSYLVAIAAGPFDTVPIPGTSVPARVVVPKGDAALAREAAAMTPPLLSALETYFGSRYPYEKLDLLAVPEFWYGAMENPGAITFRDDVLLLDPSSTSEEARHGLAVTIAHEVAHMWFGDLVTMRWWDDTWLNESFATWMEAKIVARVYPEFQETIRDVASMQDVMDQDALVSTHAMRQPVASVASLLQSADALAYRKGSAVLSMTERWLGPEVFRKGVLAYLKAHADGNASGDDLWNALSKASGKDVAGVLSSFLDQPGVPLVEVAPLADGRARVSQRRFLNAGATLDGAPLWKIPVTLAYPKDGAVATTSLVLTGPTATVSLGAKNPPAWIYPNAGESGYYRWSVPRPVFEALVADASRLLDPRERTALLGNAAALLDAGAMAGDAYLKLLETFAADPDPHVVLGAIGGLEKVRETFYAEKDDPAFAAFVRRALAPALARFGTARRPGETATVSELRPALLGTLALDGHDAEVIAAMDRLADAYDADPASVDPSLAGTALVVRASHGDAERFADVKRRFESAKTPDDRRRYLEALGSFRDPALIGKALDYVFTGPLKPQEAMAIPRAVGQIPGARDATWAWMTSHYDTIRKSIPQDFIVFMPYFASGCSESRLASAKAFFAEPGHDAPGTSRELAKVAESVEDCIRLAGREGQAVRAYVSAEPAAASR